MAEILPDHDHCKVCDDPVDQGMEFCSELCRDRQTAELRKEKNKNILFMVVAVAVMVGLAVIGILFRR